MTQLPFGRYRGWQLKDVPVHYLKWLGRQEFVRPELRDAIEAQLNVKPKLAPVVCIADAFDARRAAAGDRD